MIYCAVELIPPTATSVRKNGPLQLIEATFHQHAPLVRHQRPQIAIEELKATDTLGRAHQVQRRPRDDAALTEAGADAVKEIGMFGRRTAHLIALARHHIQRGDVIGLHAILR